MELTKEQKTIYDQMTKGINAGKVSTQLVKELGISYSKWDYIKRKAEGEFNKVKAIPQKSVSHKKITIPPATAPLSQMCLIRGTPEQIRQLLSEVTP